MRASSVPPSAGAPASAVSRLYGAHPFRTDGDILAVAFLADGTLCSLEEPGVLRSWNLDAHRPPTMRALEEPATLWAFSSDGRRLAAASDEIAVWDVVAGERAAVWAQPFWVTALAFRPAAEVLAVGYDDGVVPLWESRRRRPP